MKDNNGKTYFYAILATRTSRDAIMKEEAKALIERNIPRKNLFTIPRKGSYKLIRKLYLNEIHRSECTPQGKYRWEDSARRSTRRVRKWLKELAKGERDD